jgi:hypothetical protein
MQQTKSRTMPRDYFTHVYADLGEVMQSEEQRFGKGRNPNRKPLPSLIDQRYLQDALVERSQKELLVEESQVR